MKNMEAIGGNRCARIQTCPPQTPRGLPLVSGGYIYFAVAVILRTAAVRLWFVPTAVHVRFVVGNVRLGLFFLRVLRFSIVSTMPLMFHTHTH
jgi:hypothetical protein